MGGMKTSKVTQTTCTLHMSLLYKSTPELTLQIYPKMTKCKMCQNSDLYAYETEIAFSSSRCLSR